MPGDHYSETIFDPPRFSYNLIKMFTEQRTFNIDIKNENQYCTIVYKIFLHFLHYLSCKKTSIDTAMYQFTLLKL